MVIYTTRLTLSIQEIRFSEDNQQIKRKGGGVGLGTKETLYTNDMICDSLWISKYTATLLPNYY